MDSIILQFLDFGGVGSFVLYFTKKSKFLNFISREKWISVLP